MHYRKAFTLIELLVVIGVMITLMAMIMGGVMVVKNHATKVKAVSQIQQVAAAIEQYHGLNATYPELFKIVTSPPAAWVLVTDTYDVSGKLHGLGVDKDVYKEAFTGGDPIADWWIAVNATLVYQLGSLAEDLTSKAPASKGLLIDQWGKPLRYRPAKYYPFGTAASPYIDTATPPNPDGFQLWSMGKSNTVEEWGESTSDDITNWPKP